MNYKEEYKNCEFYNSKDKLSCYYCDFAGRCLTSKLNKIKELCKKNVIQEDYFDDYEKLGTSNIAQEVLSLIYKDEV